MPKAVLETSTDRGDILKQTPKFFHFCYGEKKPEDRVIEVCLDKNTCLHLKISDIFAEIIEALQKVS